MAGRIRFHLDEQVDVTGALTHSGATASTSPLPWNLAYARRERRVLVTHDADFLRLAAAGSEHAGIAFCPRTGRSVGEIIRSLLLIHEVLRPEEIESRVEFL